MGITYTLDRSLPVPLGVQLRGLIEYGIAGGQLATGEKVPSVREMASQLGIAPMTVAAVYRDLTRAQLLETRPGAGTFVANRVSEPAMVGLRRLDQMLDALLLEAEVNGLGRDALVSRLHARASLDGRSRVKIAFLGVFETASRDYAASIGSALGPGDVAWGTSIGRIETDRTLRAEAMAADLIVTIANRRAEIARLLHNGPPIAVISFIPSEATRTALAELHPLSRIAVISVFPEFLAIMKPGVQSFAPHVSAVEATLCDAPDLGAILSRATVVVHATGAESVLGLLPDGARAIEYRHTPDPRDIERTILPWVERLRHRHQPMTEPACELAK